MSKRRPSWSQGFTLIEVLVALTIVAVALLASLRATAALTASAEALQQRTLAQWSAENRLAQIRIQSEWPELGERRFACDQAALSLQCREQVFATPNSRFRRVEVSVFGAADAGVRLAQLVGFATDLP